VESQELFDFGLDDNISSLLIDPICQPSRSDYSIAIRFGFE